MKAHGSFHRFQHWDVNNEMLHGSYFSERLKPKNIRDWMFNKSKEMDPQAQLFLNDFDVIENGLLTKVRKEAM